MGILFFNFKETMKYYQIYLFILYLNQSIYVKTDETRRFLEELIEVLFQENNWNLS